MYYLLLTLYIRSISTLIIQMQTVNHAVYPELSFMKSLQHFKWKELHDSISGISAIIIDTEAAVTLCEKLHNHRVWAQASPSKEERVNSVNVHHHKYWNFSSSEKLFGPDKWAYNFQKSLVCENIGWICDSFFQVRDTTLNSPWFFSLFNCFVEDALKAWKLVQLFLFIWILLFLLYCS